MDKRHVKFIAGLALALGLLYWFTHQLDWLSVLQTLRSVDMRLIGICGVLMAITYVLRSLRWQQLLGNQQKCRFTSAFAATTIGFAALFFAGRAGEFVRPLSLSRREPVRIARSLASILIERIFDMVMVILLFGVALLFLDTSFDMPVISRLPAIRITSGILIAISAAGIYGLMVFERRADGALSALTRFMARWPKRLAEPLLSLLRSLADGLSIFVDRKSLTATILLTLVQWTMVIAFYWLAIAAFDLRLSISQTIFVFGFAMIGSSVPTPGGASGAYHAAAAGSLMLLGVERNRAAGIAIVLHLATYGPALILGCYYLIRDGHLLLAGVPSNQFEMANAPILTHELERLPLTIPFSPEVEEGEVETELI